MKTCIHCHQSKPFTEFYKHAQMSDGYLGRCKTCHKSEIHKNYLRRMSDPEWREKELDRQREKAKRHRAEGRKPDPEAEKRGKLKWLENNRHKKRANTAVGNAIRDKKLFRKPCEKCGDENSEAHHDDYSKPLDVRWLCKKHHNEHHVEMRRLERFTRDAMEQARAFPAENAPGMGREDGTPPNHDS